MKTEQEQIKEKDIEILKSLYFGNHLNNDELKRANKLIYSLNIVLKERLK